MIDKAIGPAARIMRVLIITPVTAVGLLYGVRSLVPLPWVMVRFLSRGMLALALNRSQFRGNWIWRVAYHAIATSPEACTAVALALFLGGLVALGVNRLVMRAHTQPMRPMD